MSAPRDLSRDTPLLRSIPAVRRALIERIVGARVPRSGARTSAAMRQKFLRAYFSGVAEEDLAQRAPLGDAQLDDQPQPRRIGRHEPRLEGSPDQS